MSFVITTGNKQYLVKNGQIVIVDRIEADVDSTVELPVLHATGESKSTKSIKATVLKHQKGPKIRVVKYKSKSRYHRQYGFRPYETVLKIEGTFEGGADIVTTAKTSKTTKSTAKAASKTVAKTKKAPAKKTTTPKSKNTTKTTK
jgi:large subunit ribosomal protein L21